MICRSNLHPVEVQTILEQMLILVDSREQPNKRFDERVKWFPHWRRLKLDAGDYSAEVNVSGEWIQLPVAVERKMSIDELCACFTHERKRFEREFLRAKEAGTKMYLLVEDAEWEKIYKGEYRSRLIPKSLVASLLAWSIRYNITFLFCKAGTSGRLIYDVLYREAKEFLTNEEG